MVAILKRIDWARVNRLTRRQLFNREVYCPPISLFRWWARRPHALIGALLDAARLSRGALVSDPFSGGGTVALEAAARDFTVYAQDLNPWATWGLSTALDAVDPGELQTGIETFWSAVEQSEVGRAYRSQCPSHGACKVTHTFWVRACQCPCCDQTSFLFPYSMITLASRAPDENYAYYGCARCGHVTRRQVGATARCRNCGGRFANEREALLAKRAVSCAHCHAEVPSDLAWSLPPRWTAVLVQRVCTDRSGATVYHFDGTTTRERLRGNSYQDIPSPLRAPIPPGKETAVLLRAGFSTWSGLYPARQLHTLIETSALILGLEVSEKVRNRLQLALAGAAEMAGYLCRWDRFHPKAFEALSNHRYSTMGLTVETNPIGERGRGTLRRRLAASLSAAKWSQKDLGSTTLARARVVTGSSTSQKLPSRSVRLIVTDPPYYDAIQYGELANLFLAWAKVVTGRTERWRLDLRQEAVPNTVRRSSPEDYERLLCDIFREAARTLEDDGRVLLTYHSTNFRGWSALGRALAQAKIEIIALGVGHSENERDHAKRDRLAFSRDLILECRKSNGSRCPTRPHVVTIPRTSEQRELIAAGLAIARHATGGQRAMSGAFVAATRRLGTRRIVVAKSLLDGDRDGQEIVCR